MYLYRQAVNCNKCPRTHHGFQLLVGFGGCSQGRLWWPLRLVFQPVRAIFAKLVANNFPSTTSEVSRVFVSGDMVPFHVIVLLDFCHPVRDELTKVTLTVYPIKGHCRIQPTMDRLHSILIDRSLNVCCQLYGHMTSNQF